MLWRVITKELLLSSLRCIKLPHTFRNVSIHVVICSLALEGVPSRLRMGMRVRLGLINLVDSMLERLILFFLEEWVLTPVRLYEDLNISFTRDLRNCLLNLLPSLFKVQAKPFYVFGQAIQLSFHILDLVFILLLHSVKNRLVHGFEVVDCPIQLLETSFIISSSNFCFGLGIKQFLLIWSYNVVAFLWVTWNQLLWVRKVVQIRMDILHVTIIAFLSK